MTNEALGYISNAKNILSMQFECNTSSAQRNFMYLPLACSIQRLKLAVIPISIGFLNSLILLEEKNLTDLL